jgi:hypothetical protein
MSVRSAALWSQRHDEMAAAVAVNALKSGAWAEDMRELRAALALAETLLDKIRANEKV